MITTVNGEALELEDGETVAQLLRRLDAPTEGVAVAVDGEVIPRAEHAAHHLRAGQKVEVIRAVGGG